MHVYPMNLPSLHFSLSGLCLDKQDLSCLAITIDTKQIAYIAHMKAPLGEDNLTTFKKYIQIMKKKKECFLWCVLREDCRPSTLFFRQRVRTPARLRRCLVDQIFVALCICHEIYVLMVRLKFDWFRSFTNIWQLFSSVSFRGKLKHFPCLSISAYLY